MVTPLAPGVSGQFDWRPAALSEFLTALARSLGARLTHFVSIDANSSTGSSPAGPASAAELSRFDTVARQWLAGGHGATVRLSVDGLLVDIASVRSASGDALGALIVARGIADSTDREIAALEIELAAALVPSVLGCPPAAAVRQAWFDWVSAQTGGRTAFAVSIDRIGDVNDALGYSAGDLLLSTVVKRLESWAGPSGRVATAGGARYIVIRTDVTDRAAAERAAARLLSILAAPVELGTVSTDPPPLNVSPSASIGVSIDAQGSGTAEVLLIGAVRSGASARAGGGDRVEFYDDGAASERLVRLQLELELHGALGSGQLRVHYQPEYDLRTGAVVAVEALLRWEHPHRGLLTAESFVPATEQSPAFAAVQRWVIDTTCRQLARWRAAGLADEIILRLNVAAPQLVRAQGVDVLIAALERDGLPGRQLCVELTERRMPTAADDVAFLVARLHAWRARGVTVALDDFGTGDGTLTHLLDLPVDVVKIDQYFVAQMRSDTRAAAIVSGVVSLARSLHLDVVAEGVDGPLTSQALLRLGCDRAQGNGLAEAMAPERLEELLRRQLAPR